MSATHEFTFVLDRDPTDDEVDALFAAGCDDASPETARGGVSLLHFDREAPSLYAAMTSALHDTREAGFTVTAVQSEDLVSLRDIAVRTGRTYESVRLLATGQRGPGGFPPPYRCGDWSLYSWTQVLQWLGRHFRTTAGDNTYDRMIAAADLMVRAQRTLDQAAPQTEAREFFDEAA